jgi:hypothetical protein
MSLCNTAHPRRSRGYVLENPFELQNRDARSSDLMGKMGLGES